MINYYKIITSNHSLTDVSNLGQLMLDPDHLQHKLTEIKRRNNVDEILYLSTCNRVIYLLYTKESLDKQYLTSLLQNIVGDGVDTETIFPLLAVYEGLEAINHILEVAGSIDSMVVGEREIFRQFRNAYDECNALGCTGDNLRLLQKKVVQVSKKIHTNTRIGEKPLSIAALAMGSILNENKRKDNQIIFIGAGETNRLLGKLLLPKAIGKYTVFNRSEENGKRLAQFMAGNFHSLNQFCDFKGTADIIIVCTSSTNPVLNINEYKALKNKSRTATLIVDLSVPNNVSSEVSCLDDVKYISIEDLKELAKKNLEHRKKEIYLAKEIIGTALKEFYNTYNERKLEIALSKIPQQIKEVKEKAINEVYKNQIDSLDQDSKSIVLEILGYMEKKCVSIPMKAAKENLL